jgi:hypothetical protein
VSDVHVDGVSVVTAGVANITLPTVNDGTLTIQKNGTTIDTFTANSSANKTVDISVPTKTSDLTNDSGFITSSSLPTVNDGTLTIQKNGTTIDTFTANSSSNKTVDISVPTKTSDLTNDSGFITSAALPTVNDATLTIQKNGSTVDTFTANASSNKTVNITVPTNTSDLTNDSGFITSGDIPAQVQSNWTENDSSDPAYIQNKPTTTPLVAGANISISDTQNGVVVAADLSSKEDEFDAGDGLEFTTDGQGNRVLQVEAPVDIVAGPGIVIDNPDGNTLRVSVAQDMETVLWESNNADGTAPSGFPLTLSGLPANFDIVRFYYRPWSTNNCVVDKMGGQSVFMLEASWLNTAQSAAPYSFLDVLTLTGTSLAFTRGCFSQWSQTTVTEDTGYFRIYKIVGIHRIANN